MRVTCFPWYVDAYMRSLFPLHHPSHYSRRSCANICSLFCAWCVHVLYDPHARFMLFAGKMVDYVVLDQSGCSASPPPRALPRQASQWNEQHVENSPQTVTIAGEASCFLPQGENKEKPADDDRPCNSPDSTLGDDSSLMGSGIESVDACMAF